MPRRSLRRALPGDPEQDPGDVVTAFHRKLADEPVHQRKTLGVEVFDLGHGVALRGGRIVVT
jgi:hypothetical protein